MRLGMDLDQLRTNIGSMTPEEQKIAFTALSKMGIDLSKLNSELTGTKVVGFVFGNKVYEADSHKDIFLKVIEIVLRKHNVDKEKVLQIKGPKRVYFSKSVKDFPHGYERVQGTDIYAGTNENAKTLNQRCQKVMALYGIDPASLSVLTAKI